MDGGRGEGRGREKQPGWWPEPVIAAVWMLRQEDGKLEPRLGNLVILAFKEKKLIKIMINSMQSHMYIPAHVHIYT